MIKSTTVILALMFLIGACSKSSSSSGGNGGGGGSTTCSGVTNNKYAADVSPIVSTTCATNAGCHGTGSSNGPGPLTTYSQIFAARAQIKTVVANGTMPQNGTLTTAQKNSIICWIDSGAPQN